MHARMTQSKLKKAEVVEAQAKMDQTLEFLEKQLSKGSPYICGENLTIADLLILKSADVISIGAVIVFRLGFLAGLSSP